VFRHDDVLAVLRDPATFSSETARLTPAARPVARGMLTQIDPPEHRALRTVVSRAFTPRTVAGLEPRIRELTRTLLDAAGERFDLVDALAFPLPVTVIAQLLGLPDSDHDQFRAWADGLFSMQVDDPTDPSLRERMGAAMAGITDYLVARVRERRSAPREDLVTALVQAEVDGRALDDEEAANFSMLLLLAGHITTTVLLGNAVRTFEENPGVWETLAADPSRIPDAVEEVLRLRSPFTQTGRATTREVEIGGTVIPADSFVLPWLLSANRDPSAFADPDRFDLDRGLGGGSQLAFGHGVHFCLGAPLARLEARVALEEMTARWSALHVDHVDDRALRHYPRGVLGVRTLPVHATPR
jgi:erythromycin 12 hydroxylase